LRNLNPEQRRAVCGQGFEYRAFDEPNGWFIDKSQRLPAENWYAVPADGDGLI
jgi:hypothetical protein